MNNYYSEDEYAAEDYETAYADTTYEYYDDSDDVTYMSEDEDYLYRPNRRYYYDYYPSVSLIYGSSLFYDPFYWDWYYPRYTIFSPYYNPYYYGSWYSGYWNYYPYYHSTPSYHKYRTNHITKLRDNNGGRGYTTRSRDDYRTRSIAKDGLVSRNESSRVKTRTTERVIDSELRKPNITRDSERKVINRERETKRVTPERNVEKRPVVRDDQRVKNSTPSRSGSNVRPGNKSGSREIISKDSKRSTYQTPKPTNSRTGTERKSVTPRNDSKSPSARNYKTKDNSSPKSTARSGSSKSGSSKSYTPRSKSGSSKSYTPPKSSGSSKSYSPPRSSGSSKSYSPPRSSGSSRSYSPSSSSGSRSSGSNPVRKQWWRQ